jgi:tRNA(Ile)-lysidine synthase
MSLMLPEKVMTALEPGAGETPGSAFVVACSGGADSTALLLALHEMSKEKDLRLIVAHAHHQLRGAESDADEEFVRALAWRLRLPYEVRRLELSPQSTGNLEARARRKRYDFLAEVAIRHGACVVTAHTLDDQAETFVLKLIRGAGAGGLSGIARRRRHQDPTTGRWAEVRRPLLGVRRREVLDYLTARGQEFRVDRTNLSSDLDRNWVRNELLPRLQERLNPRTPEVLSRTAGILQEVDEFLRREAAKWLEDRCEQQAQGIVLTLKGWEPLPEALKKTTLRLLFERVAGSLAGLTFGHVATLEELVEGRSGRRAHLPGGWVGERDFDSLWIGRLSPVPRVEQELSLPGIVELPSLGKRVAVRFAGPEESADFCTASSHVLVRTRRPGDRVGSSAGAAPKLKRRLMESKIPLRERDRLVVIEACGRLVWVEGLGNRFECRERSGLPYRVEIETFGGMEPSI